MNEVTVVIPVKNEEINIGYCLEKLDGFADIVVVDSGSTDRTQEIVQSKGVNYLNFIWDGKFPKKRNWVLKNYPFKTKWVLFLDADEIVTEEFKLSLTDAIKESSKVGYWLTYNNYFQGKLLKHGVPMRKLALMRVGAGAYEHIEENRWCNLDMEIHEHPILKGEIGFMDAPIVHHDYKGLFHYIARHNEYSSWEAQRYIDLQGKKNEDLIKRQKWKYRLLNTIWWAPLYFFINYFVKGGFMDGRIGLRFSIFKMIYFYQIRCKIKELKKLDR